MERRERRPAFTLLELLIVIIILGVLAALALPQYLRTVEKGRSSEAIIQLGTLRTGEINYYVEHRTYTDQFDLLDVDDPNRLPAPPNGTRLFDYTLTVPAPDTFTASAHRIQADGTDEVVIMNENGKMSRILTGP